MPSSPQATTALRRSTLPDSSGYWSRKLTRARATERRLLEGLEAHRREMLAMEAELAQARVREAADGGDAA